MTVERNSKERRKGSSWLWMVAGWVATGERRSGFDRRQKVVRISSPACLEQGCQGPCRQGNLTCDGKPLT